MLSKVELATNYAEKFGTTKKEAEDCINQVVSVIKDAIINDGGVKFTGIFTLQTAIRAGRDFKNPATGETVHKEDAKTVKLKVGSALKEELNA